MSKWDSGGRIKVERGREHIAALTEEVRAFHESKPYVMIPSIEASTGDRVVHVRVLNKPPARWAAIAADAIHNFRSALDLLWHQAVYPAGGGEEDNGCSFAIYHSKDAFDKAQSRVARSPRHAAEAVYRSVKPYKDGNEYLWLLKRANNIDKHRALIPAYGSLGHTIMDFAPLIRHNAAKAGFPGDVPSIPLPLDWAEPDCPLLDGAEIYRFRNPPDGAPDLEPKFVITVAFGEGELRGRPMVETLSRMGDAVDEVVAAFRGAGVI